MGRWPRRLLCLSLFWICLLLNPAVGLGLDVVEQFPIFSSHMVRTTAPLTVIFDQPLDPASIHDGSFYVTLHGQTEHIAGQLSISSVHQPDDSVTFRPTARWRWGARYQVHISADVRGSGGGHFSGEPPERGIFAANIPNDFALPVYDPDDPMSMFVDSLELMGFDPFDPESAALPWQIPGSNITEAWKYTIGDPRVIIAVLDDGIADYGQSEVRRAFFLNSGELPLPNVGGAACAEYDCNSDGRFDVDDYADDDRVASDGPVDAYDLILAFSDGVDDDGNGLTDDISGWDFLRGTNDVFGMSRTTLGIHGQWQIDHIAARGDDGAGTAPGICPECMILPIRASHTIVYDYGPVAAGVRYATAMGAQVISFAGANLTWSQSGHQAIVDAYDQGTIMVAVSGDEMTFHHWMPAAGEDVLSVKSMFALLPVELWGLIDLEQFSFVETYCTNYGPHVQLAVPVGGAACSSEATAAASGMLGLLYSYALQQGIELEADQAKQLLTLSAYDISERCASIVNLLGVCHPGVDEHFGYGRPDLGAAMRQLGDPDFDLEPALGPTVRVRRPLWWQTVDLLRTPELEVEGELRCPSYPCDWQVELARGHEPLEAAFKVVAEGAADSDIDGPIASVPLYAVFTEDWAAGEPLDQHSFEATLRVRATCPVAGGAAAGEARKTFSVHIDDDPRRGLVPGFPLWIGASGESSPLLYDLDNAADQRLEIVFGTGAGAIEAFKYDAESGAWISLPGFPIDLAGDDPWVQDTIFASLAVADLFNDGTAEIVAATTHGLVYAIDPAAAAAGRPLLPGFPVAADAPDASSPESFAEGNGFFASPVLADLDDDGILEIVAAALDQKVYAWRLDPDGVERLAGWPVLCRSSAGSVPEELVCRDPAPTAPILGTPAVGVLDRSNPDPEISEYPAVVVTTNESCSAEPFHTTRAYAVFHDGTEHPGGPFLPGWPVALPAPLSDLVPIPMVAGAAAAPAVQPMDWGSRVLVATTGWFPLIINYAESRTFVEEISTSISLNLSGSPAISDLDGAGEPQMLLPVVGAVELGDLGFELFNSRLLALDMARPHRRMMEGRIEDIPLLSSAVAVDLDNDGEREVLSGTGGYLVHAFSIDGSEPQGWPKWTHNWVMAAPAAADMDADGLIEVVVNTREGWLYAWESEGLACPGNTPGSDWRRFHHDERNSGFYAADTLPPSRVVDLEAASVSGDRVRLEFIAPGDDWNCGTAQRYDVRFSTDASADLLDPTQFAAAARAQIESAPLPAGEDESFEVRAPAARAIALRTIDRWGNLSAVSNIALVERESDDDDDAHDQAADEHGCCGSS